MNHFHRLNSLRNKKGFCQRLNCINKSINIIYFPFLWKSLFHTLYIVFLTTTFFVNTMTFKHFKSQFSWLPRWKPKGFNWLGLSWWSILKHIEVTVTHSFLVRPPFLFSAARGSTCQGGGVHVRPWEGWKFWWKGLVWGGNVGTDNGRRGRDFRWKLKWWCWGCCHVWFLLPEMMKNFISSILWIDK